MATLSIPFCFFFMLFFFLFVSPYIDTGSNATLFHDINWWCNQTPNPNPCKHFMVRFPTPKHKLHFREMATQVAMGQAMAAHAVHKRLGPKCKSDIENVAWSDCVSHYDSAILHLNRTLTHDCTELDRRTWLSAALTDIETCKVGFDELNVTNGSVWPLMDNNNVSMLISNSLAMIEATKDNEDPHNETEFPKWVSTHDRELLQAVATTVTADIVVARDGSGHFKTIKEALETGASNRTGNERYIIHVKKGVYEEYVEMGMQNIMLVGDGTQNTIITGNRSVGGGDSTFTSATLTVTGQGFMARGITIRNTAGPQNYQAVALRSGADFSVFYQCSLEGYQDTLYAHSLRQFYKNCSIYGTIDFIFGNAAAIFQSCKIYARKPLPFQKNTITAQGKTNLNQSTGFMIHDSRITAASDLEPVLDSIPTYLGRPWQQYSRTIVMRTYLDSLINAAGWLEWDGDFPLNTLYYAEYMNTGPGSSTAGRVKWAGYRVIKGPSEAAQFSVTNFIEE